MSKLTLKQKRFADEYIAKPYGVVYCIKNKENGKRYIGITTRKIAKRFKEHCKADSIIGKAIKKYGINNFLVYQIEEADDKESLFELEKYYIRKYNTFKCGYNATIGGDGVVGDIYLNVALNNKQRRFVDFVTENNKKSIDISDAKALVRTLLLNMAQIYLICEKKTDKRDSAKMLLKLQRPFLEQLLKLQLFDLEELRRWSRWQNTQNG